MNKKCIVALLLFVLGLILLTTGVTYAAFRGAITGATTQTITANSITFQYIEKTGKGHGISITDVFPVEDNDLEKENNNYFDFKITASVDGFAVTPYVVTAKMNDGSSSSLGNIVDMYLTEVINKGQVNESEVPTTLFTNTLPKYNGLEQYNSDNTERIIYTGLVTDKNYSKDFRLRMWVDEVVESSIDNDFNNQTFSVTVNVYATGKMSTLPDLILADNPVIRTNPTLGVLTSTSNENGLYKMSVTNGFGGANGDTYYFRGNVTNNVVEFAGLTWRVVRINEDGTVRLILDEFIRNLNDLGSDGYYIYRFYNDNTAGYNYMYYSNTATEGDPDFPNIKYIVDRWYQETIVNNGYGSRVATGNYFCEAARVAENDGFRTLTGTTSMTIRPNYSPTLSCLEDANHHQYVPGSVGLITYDEAAYAGAVSYITGNTYYLNTDANGNRITDAVSDTWWTMSPGGINTNDNNIVYAWAINNTYDLTEFYIDYKLHVRPVINIKADAITTKDIVTGHYIVQ